jgi:SAM-dependent methyltransferase
VEAAIVWMKMKCLVKKLLGLPLPPKSFELIREKEAELGGLFNCTRGELFAGFAIDPADIVVDVGCGDGVACIFAGRLGAEIIAVDIDPSAIDRVEECLRGEASIRSWQTHVSDSNPLPLASGIATKVVCQEVLEHVDDPAVVLAELVRIGKPGAQYLLTVPDPVAESVQRHLAPPLYWTKPNHLRIFERQQFDRLVQDAGLTIETRASYSFFWSMWWILFWAGKVEGPFGGAGSPVLRYWNKTWQALLEARDGARVKQVLDGFMPKSQVILARKAA